VIFVKNLQCQYKLLNAYGTYTKGGSTDTVFLILHSRPVPAEYLEAFKALKWKLRLQWSCGVEANSRCTAANTPNNVAPSLVWPWWSSVKNNYRSLKPAHINRKAWWAGLRCWARRWT